MAASTLGEQLIQVRTNTKWTKELVQSHAKTAVLIEMYTLPFYLTVMTSIKLPEKSDTSERAKLTNLIYKTILSVCIEEMLHLQLAANLCLALDIPPLEIFPNPVYGEPIPYIQPYDPETMGAQRPNHVALLNANLGVFNQDTLNIMLDIETPTEFDASVDHTTPQYPYATIGQMYDALLQGILEVEADVPVFSWSTKNQQEQFTGGQSFSQNILRINQKIACFGDAQQAVKLICDQGEGLTKDPLPTKPFTEEQFTVYAGSRFYENAGFNTESNDDGVNFNRYSHYARFLWIKNQLQGKALSEWPETYPVSGQFSLVQSQALKAVMTNFSNLIDYLTAMWSGQNDGAKFFDQGGVMYNLIPTAQKCWSKGLIPQWNQYKGSIKLYPFYGELNFSMGQSWTTDSGYTLIFQDDNNLVLYGVTTNDDREPSAVWASNTQNKNCTRLTLKQDGNLYLYDDSGDTPIVVWSTNIPTSKTDDENSLIYLSIKSDGSLGIYKDTYTYATSTSTLWSSKLNSK